MLAVAVAVAVGAPKPSTTGFQRAARRAMAESGSVLVASKAFSLQSLKDFVKRMEVDMDREKSDAGTLHVKPQARNETTNRLFPKAKRVPAGLFKSLINRQLFEGINPLSILIRGPSTVGQEGLIIFLWEPDLWRLLAATYGRCDCMVEGKYKRARVFAFETESHIHMVCERGER